MRNLILLAILAAGLLIAGLVTSSFVGETNRPHTIHNPYVTD